MAHGNSVRPARQVEADYAINWRAAGLIAVLLLLCAIIPLSRHLWLPYYSHGSAPRADDKLQHDRQLATSNGTASHDDHQSLVAEPFTPWRSRDADSKRTSLNVIRKDSHRHKTSSPEPSIDQYVDASAYTADMPVQKFEQSEQELAHELEGQSVELSIDAVKDMRAALMREAINESGIALINGSLPGEGPFFQMFAARPEFEGLPLRRDSQCRKAPESLKYLKEISATFRRLRFERGSTSDAESEAELELSITEMLHDHQAWYRPEAVRTIVQVLQARTYPSRMAMVDFLVQIPGDEAASALVDAALFDLSPGVRESAIQGLKRRTLSESARQRLLEGLRYPWTFAADNAATAVVALELRDAVSKLEDMADEPAPTDPFLDADGKWRKLELVRMNHLRNCLLCHPTSVSKKDPVRGLIPTPGEALPQEYYGAQDGDFVHADTTYLQQDFSVVHYVKGNDPWGEYQRFDYMKRTRTLTAEETAKLEVVQNEENRAKETASYPQRDAVLRAIRELESSR